MVKIVSYGTAMQRMKSNPTNGEEFGLDSSISKENQVSISRTDCEYCGKEVLAVWDKHNNMNWWPYLGNMAKKVNTYKYSPIINIMKENDNSLNKVWQNNLLNVHARIHSSDWGLRCKKGSIKILCNDCFQKTYNRIQVRLNDGSIIAVSVVEDMGETIESVMEELNIKGEVIGKGGKF